MIIRDDEIPRWITHRKGEVYIFLAGILGRQPPSRWLEQAADNLEHIIRLTLKVRLTGMTWGEGRIFLDPTRELSLLKGGGGTVGEATIQ